MSWWVIARVSSYEWGAVWAVVRVCVCVCVFVCVCVCVCVCGGWVDAVVVVRGSHDGCYAVGGGPDSEGGVRTVCLRACARARACVCVCVWGG